MSDSRIALEDNELTFVAHHRSTTCDLGFARLLVSSEPTVVHWNFAASFRSGKDSPTTVLEKCSRVFRRWERRPCLKITPMTEPNGLEDELLARGWALHTRFVHMASSLPPTRRSSDVQVRRCKTVEDLKAFTEVQNKGFGAPVEWKNWFYEINRRNLLRRNQVFYLAEVTDQPVGVCVLFNWRRIGGLYAVATLEEARGRGVAASLVSAAVQDSKRLGNHSTCLNTLVGGAAATAFQRLGFEDVFESRFYIDPGN